MANDPHLLQHSVWSASFRIFLLFRVTFLSPLSSSLLTPLSTMVNFSFIAIGEEARQTFPLSPFFLLLYLLWRGSIFTTLDTTYHVIGPVPASAIGSPVSRWRFAIPTRILPCILTCSLLYLCKSHILLLCRSRPYASMSERTNEGKSPKAGGTPTSISRVQYLSLMKKDDLQVYIYIYRLFANFIYIYISKLNS